MRQPDGTMSRTCDGKTSVAGCNTDDKRSQTGLPHQREVKPPPRTAKKAGDEEKTRKGASKSDGTADSGLNMRSTVERA